MDKNANDLANQLLNDFDDFQEELNSEFNKADTTDKITGDNNINGGGEFTKKSV